MDIRFLVILLFIFTAASCRMKVDDEWTVLTAGLPYEIKTENADSLLVAYILKQTHEPLFRKQENGGFVSNVLDRWSRNSNYSEFIFCIDSPKYFNDVEIFDINSLLNHLKNNVNRTKEIYIKLINNNCLKQTFKKANFNYLNLLSKIENAPTINSKNPKVENGLGSYELVSLDKDSIRLDRKKKIDNAFNSIRFINIDSFDQSNLEQVEDFNYIPINRIPESIKNEYKSFEITYLATGVLVLNIENYEIRNRLFNCLNIQLFRSAIVPGKTNFIDIASLLPIGIKGSIPGLINQSCLFDKTDKHLKLKFKIWEDVDLGKLSEVMNDLKLKTGLDVKIITRKYSDLLQDIYSRKDDIFPILFDTKVTEYEPFFESLAYGNKRVIKYSYSEIDQLYNLLLNESNLKKKSMIAYNLQQEILSKKIVIPLMQKKRTLYYPLKVKSLDISDDFMGFPDVKKLNI